MKQPFDFSHYDKTREEDIKGEARIGALFALRKAWKELAEGTDVKAHDLAIALGKDKGYVSRVLNGRAKTTLETLAVFLDAMGFTLPLEPVRVKSLTKANFDMRPHGIDIEPARVIAGNTMFWISNPVEPKSPTARVP